LISPHIDSAIRSVFNSTTENRWFIGGCVMGLKHVRRYCPADQQPVLAVKQTPNHILHLLLSVVTFGMWLPVWLVISLLNEFDPWLCPNCGSKTEARIPKAKPGDARITG
jgi:hypothetical protein